MKKTIDGKRYDTEKCEELGDYDHYNYSNTYSGTSTLLRASDGKLLVHCSSNGQDLYLNDHLETFDDYLMRSEYRSIDSFNMDDNQEKRCAELGLIKII